MSGPAAILVVLTIGCGFHALLMRAVTAWQKGQDRLALGLALIWFGAYLLLARVPLSVWGLAA